MLAAMPTFALKARNRSQATIGPHASVLTVGRSPQNDWTIEDASLSRQHARFEWDGRGLSIQDLGSKFGTALNGQSIEDRAGLKPGDELILGNVLVEVVELGLPTVHIDARTAPDLGLAAFTMPAERVRGGEGAGSGPLPQALAFIHELTLGLIREVSPQELLEALLNKLMGYLDADRGVVLLKDPQGALQPAAIRVRGSGGGNRINLSQTLVEAALERREALLLTDPEGDPELASRSLILSGVTTAIVTPLEAEGQVIGLVYFDSRSLLRQFSRDDLQLAATLAHVAAAKLHGARLLAEAQRTRAMEQEMAIARDIQLRMLPMASPPDSPAELYAELRSAREVGGDLYDYRWQDGRLHFCIGDVSGKGVPAALVMALTKTLFRASGAFLEDPSRLMAAVNGLLYEATAPGIFVSALCGRFDPADGRLVFSNAGHEPPVILSPSGPARFLETAPGLALGILAEFSYPAQETVLQAGEALLLYTDGVTEALNPARELFTADRLLAELERRPDEAPEALVGHLMGALARFTAGAPQADDITLMCLRHRRRPATPPSPARHTEIPTLP